MKKTNPITGLIFYAFYSARGNILMLSTSFAFSGIGLLITGDTTIFAIFLGLGISALSCGLIINGYKDSVSGWNKFRLAMPVKRSDVIKSAYLGHLLMLLIAVVFSGVFVGLSVLLHENLLAYVKTSGSTIILLYIESSLITCAVFYPVVYAVSANIYEALSITCLMGGGGVIVLVLLIGRKFNLLNTMPFNVITVVAAVVLFIVSYFITAKIYTKKDL